MDELGAWLTTRAISDRLAEATRDACSEVVEGNYHLHYEALRWWFSGIGTQWTGEAVILGSLAVYGWMPTILEGRTPLDKVISREKSEEIALKLKVGDEALSRTFVNGSVVGTSKFLHFWRPHRFAIWDSRVRRATLGPVLGKRQLASQTRAVDEYNRYNEAMRSLVAEHSPPDWGAKMREMEFRLFCYGKYLLDKDKNAP